MTAPNRYTIKEIFVTLQGEGMRAGTKAVFVRFAGCNLWNGKADGREKGTGACAKWCDTEFTHGASMTAKEIEARAHNLWTTDSEADRWVVLTGGEPLLQLDQELVDELHKGGWRIALETNGTLDPMVTTDKGVVPLTELLDWVTVSPKLGSDPKLLRGDELKVVIPGALPPDPGWTPEALQALGAGRWKHKLVQPQDPATEGAAVGLTFLHGDGANKALAGVYQLHMQRCVSWVAENPDWRLSMQQHKFLGLP